MKTKQIILIIIILAAVITLFLVFRNFGKVKLDKPESIVYDPVSEKFLISNVGNGNIVAMDEQGSLSEFISGEFDAPKGMIIHADKLYITDPNQIHVVKLSEAKIVESFYIEGAKGLNDIAIDEYGKLYITDTIDNCVFVYDPTSKTQERLSSPLLQAPNGIIYDKPRWQMFIVNLSQHSPIISLNTRDKSFSIFKDTMYSDLDGIAIDDLGRIFFSSWKENMIIEIPQEQNRFVTNFKGYDGAADIYYHLPGNELLVPMFKHNKIERIPLD